MKIRANIKYPPPKFETRDLALDELYKLVDALTKELVMTNRQLGSCEAMLEKCEEYFCDGKSLKEQQLLVAIKEVLK